MKPARPNDEQLLEVSIERIVPDGYGIAFAENLTIFVPLVAAGDLVKIKIDRIKGKIAFASLIEVLKPSPDRIEPFCQYFGRCGGCDFQQMNYAAQLLAKTEIIRDCLRRIGKIDYQKTIEIIASPSQTNYRTRVQWKYDRENNAFGYYGRHSHNLLDVARCPILTDALQAELDFWHIQSKTQKLKFKEIQAVAANNQISRRIFQNDANPSENFYAANHQLEKQSEINRASDNVTAEKVNLKVNEFEYQFDANVFFQVNHLLLSKFVENVVSQSRGNYALDLYCGVGLFTLPLAKRFAHVTGIESNQASVDFARLNAANAKLENARFEIARVGAWLGSNKQSLPLLDLVLLDPPRAGAECEAIEGLIFLQPEAIVYVSCDPATLARDLRLLRENNYAIEQITAFDFFPNTHHVETVAHLKRKM